MVSGEQSAYEDLAGFLAMAVPAQAAQPGTVRRWSFSVPEPDLPLPTQMTLSLDLAGHILMHTQWETTEVLMQAILARLALAGFVEATADE